ncbi:hypothetical protein LCGC14_0808700, partial [marine sediment metagenome]
VVASIGAGVVAGGGIVVESSVFFTVVIDITATATATAGA